MTPEFCGSESAFDLHVNKKSHEDSEPQNCGVIPQRRKVCGHSDHDSQRHWCMQEDEEFFLKRHRQALVGMVAQLAELSAHDLADPVRIPAG